MSSGHEKRLQTVSEQVRRDGVEAANLSDHSKVESPKHTPAFQNLRSPATSHRASRSSTMNSEASTTESEVLANGATNTAADVGERSQSPDKRYRLKEQNAFNNYGSIAQSVTPPLGPTPPPRLKTLTQPQISLNDDPGTTLFKASNNSSPDIREDGLGLPPTVEAPPPPPRVQSRAVLIAKKVRFSCCLLSTFLVLTALVMIVLWPTVISTNQTLPQEYIGLDGLVMFKASTLARGGMLVTLNIGGFSDKTDASKLHPRAYFGPRPSDSLYTSSYVSVIDHEDKINISNSSASFFLGPYAFEMGRDNSSFTLDYKLTVNGTDIVFSDLDIQILVYNSSRNALSRNASLATSSVHQMLHKKGSTLTYAYDSISDNSDEHVLNTLFGANRYFVIKISDLSAGNENHLNQILFSPTISVHSNGNLDFAALNTMLNYKINSETIIQWDISYGPFYSEINSDNVVLIETKFENSSNPIESDPIPHMLPLSASESIRPDILGFLCGLVVVVVFLVVLSYMFNPLRKRLRAAPLIGCCQWTKNRLRQGYNALA